MSRLFLKLRKEKLTLNVLEVNGYFDLLCIKIKPKSTNFLPSSNCSSVKKAKIELVFDDGINHWFDVAGFRIFLSNGDCSDV